MCCSRNQRHLPLRELQPRAQAPQRRPGALLERCAFDRVAGRKVEKHARPFENAFERIGLTLRGANGEDDETVRCRLADNAGRLFQHAGNCQKVESADPPLRTGRKAF